MMFSVSEVYIPKYAEGPLPDIEKLEDRHDQAFRKKLANDALMTADDGL
jgi:hypothetical protein